MFEDGADGEPDESTYELLRVDAVVANPPYSQSWDPSNRDNDPRFKRYGLAPSSKADYAFLLHNLYHIKPDGIVTIVLPHGVLFRGGEEERIRKNLVENNNIDAIIGLPANIFFGTGIPTIIMVLKQKRENTDILIIDASKGFEKVGKNNKLRACDIKKIADTIALRGPGDGVYSRLVSREEVRKNEYNLNIPRYVDSSEKPEPFDIKAIMLGGLPNKEIGELRAFWKEFPTLKDEIFETINPTYCKVRSLDGLKKTIEQNKDVIRLTNTFTERFADFQTFLRQKLILDMLSVSTVKEEAAIGEEITERLSFTSLIDPYAAYQLLDNQWGIIATDLEIIQSEGISAIRLVDPNMVIKKKDKKEVEVQEGWKGHILPFELVQRELLSDEYQNLNDVQIELDGYNSTIEEILESIEEDDKQSPIWDDEKESFVMAGIAKKAKEYAKAVHASEELALKRYDEESIEWKILSVSIASSKQKVVKAIQKDLSNELINKTKRIIEGLSEQEYLMLLEKKWISPFIESLNAMPQMVLESLVKKIISLHKKYEETLHDIDDQIEQTSIELAAMLDELVGDDDDMVGLAEFKASLLHGGQK